MAEVILDKVRKVYTDGGFVAVDDFNLKISDREFIVLVGPSGCGKTTTLRMIAGLEEITDGTISIDGKVVNDVPPKDRDIAMVFQNYALYPHMSVFDNMAFGLKLRHMPKKEIMERVGEAAEILGLDDEMLTRRPKALSGGQRQRVAVGRAIVRKPKVFVFDEPLSNLDAKMRVQMRVEINRLHHRLGATMVYVTHDQTEAMTMGDRIVVMEKGCVRQIADPLTLYSKPADKFTAGFIGMPPMNFIDGGLVKDGGAFVFKNADVSIPLPAEWGEELAPHAGANVTFGIRPEDIGSPLAMATAGLPSLKMEIDVTEPMGSETYVYAKVGGASFVARVDAQTTLKAGMGASLPISVSRAHIFDNNGVVVV